MLRKTGTIAVMGGVGMVAGWAAGVHPLPVAALGAGAAAIAMREPKGQPAAAQIMAAPEPKSLPAPQPAPSPAPPPLIASTARPIMTTWDPEPEIPVLNTTSWSYGDETSP